MYGSSSKIYLLLKRNNRKRYIWFTYYWYFSLLTVNHIRNGIDILVGTPGRIKDHLQSGRLDLSKLRHVVLDEVDQMLDLGFAEQVEDIIHESYKTGIS